MTSVRIRQRSGRCFYCDTPVYPAGSAEVIQNPRCMTTKDHVIPQLFRSKGCQKVDGATNIVTACQGCNNVKGGYPQEPFMYFLRQYRGTSLFTHAEFKKFIFGLALAGFRVAMHDARRRVERSAAPLPPRSPQGRFTKRDLRRAS